MSRLLENPKDLHHAAALLRDGTVVAMPTETVYGLAASVRQADGIDRIFRIKERPFFDPLIVHLSEAAQVLEVAADFPPLAQKLAARFWPGPLTMVLPKRADLNTKITSGLETVGVRVPDHALARELIRLVGAPLAAPSANKFGRTSPTSAAHVRSEFGDDVFVLDGGDCRVGVESTVIGFSADFSEVRMYRPGAVTLEMLREFAPVSRVESPAAPGHLEHHYMPVLPLVILSSSPFLTEALYDRLKLELGVEVLHPSWMRLPLGDATLAARALYSGLRVAAAKPEANAILLSYDLDLHSEGLFAAITDRLRKAATVVV